MKKIKIYLHPEDFDMDDERLDHFGLPSDCPLARAIKRRGLFKYPFVGIDGVRKDAHSVRSYKFNFDDWRHQIAKNVRDCYKADPEMKEAIYYVELTKV